MCRKTAKMCLPFSYATRTYAGSELHLYYYITLYVHSRSWAICMYLWCIEKRPKKFKIRFNIHDIEILLNTWNIEGGIMDMSVDCNVYLIEPMLILCNATSILFQKRHPRLPVIIEISSPQTAPSLYVFWIWVPFHSVSFARARFYMIWMCAYALSPIDSCASSGKMIS